MSKATKSRSRTLWGNGRGQSLVEFALILPLLLVVAFIITEFGRALWIKNALTSAAGVAARAAIVSNVTNYEKIAYDAADRVLDAQFMGLGDAYPATTIQTELKAIAGGQQAVTVRLRREFSFVPSGEGGLPTTPGAKGPFIGLGTFVIVGEAIMETQPNFGG
jgi:Flp pilus assembly protein TadG